MEGMGAGYRARRAGAVRIVSGNAILHGPVPSAMQAEDVTAQAR
jgi:hypothetical protein